MFSPVIISCGVSLRPYRPLLRHAPSKPHIGKCYGGVVSLYLPNPFFFLHTFSRFLCRNGDSVLSCNHLFLIGSFYVDMCVNVRSQSRLFPIGIFETCSSVFGNFLTCFCKFLSVSVLRRLVDCSAPRGRMYFRLCFPKNGRSFAFKSFV